MPDITGVAALKRVLQKIGLGLCVGQVFRGIEAGGLQRHFLFPRHGHSLADVPFLRAFVAAAEKDHHCLAAPDKIHPISRSGIDADFSDALEIFDVTEQPGFEPRDPANDGGSCPVIGQRIQPVLKNRSQADFDDYVKYSSQSVKRQHTVWTRCAAIL
jgi:hypothetical protein